MYEHHVNESRVAQYRQDRLREAGTERSLRAMKTAQERQQELGEPIVTERRLSRLRRAWQALYSLVFARV
jgi:hypothetical protein